MAGMEALRDLGFVPYRDPDGRLWFIERDEYAKLVAERKIEPGRSYQ